MSDVRVTLLTDFGMEDGYVAAMKGVLATHAPGARLDDAGHDLPQGDVTRAIWALGRYWRRFPRGTVHLVVVDPGVGTERKALAVRADDRFVVAPDNGVVSRVLDEADQWRAVEVEPARLPSVGSSVTFHGRDIFAPAAALLASGDHLDALGPFLEAPVRRREPEARRRGEEVEGVIVVEDRFGNLITNVPGSWVQTGWAVGVADRRVLVETTYGDVEPGDLLALVNSSERLELAVRNGSAAAHLDVGPGTQVRASPGRAEPNTDRR